MLLTIREKVDFMGNLTIRELATSLNISKEAIYRKINYSMKNKLENEVKKVGGKTYITDKGQSIIIQSLKTEKDESQEQQQEELTTEFDVSNKTDNNVINQESQSNLDYIRHLENELALLQTRYDGEVSNNREEREANRRERETLYQLNQSLMDTFQNEQKLKATQILIDNNNIVQVSEPDHPEHPPEPKQGFFSKLFKR